MAVNSFCYVEWMVSDLERARRFYEGMFGWKFEGVGDNYLMFETPQGFGGGLQTEPVVTPGNSPVVYVHVEAIEPALARARDLGGGVHRGRTDIPGYGWYALLTDPDGNLVGLYESKSKAAE